MSGKAKKTKVVAQNPSVVVAATGKRQGLRVKFAAIGLGSVLLLVAVIGTVVVLVHDHSKRPVPLTTSQKLGAVSDALTSGDVAQAQAQLSTVEPKTQSEQEELWSDQASIAHNNGDYATALQYFEKMLSVDPNNSNVVINAANDAALAGNKAVAAKYYQQAIDMITAQKNTSSPSSSDVSYLQSQLAEVQK